MTDHGIVKGTFRPADKIIDDYSVWVNSNIREIKISDENGERTEFEFHQLQYSKEEYIKLIDAKNAILAEELTNAQIALCDVYELLDQERGGK